MAIFTGLEVKATGNLRPRQKKVGDMIKLMGGGLRLVRESDAEQGDTGYLRQISPAYLTGYREK